MVVKEGSHFKDVIIIILLIILALVLIYFIGLVSKPTTIYLTNQTNIINQTNVIYNQTTLTQSNSFIVPLNPEKEYSQYWVNLVINPIKICVGDSATGSIKSNILNGVCSIFTDTGTGFKVYKNIMLNSNGYYSETNQMNTIGGIIFRVVCCDLNRNCKISSDAYLTVEQCPPPDFDGDGIPDEIDPDDDNDDYPDDIEIEAGTDPKDPLSHPQEAEDTCNSVCITKSYVSGRGPLSSGGYCNYPEIIEYFHGNAGDICCCMPSVQITYYCCGTNEQSPVFSCTSETTYPNGGLRYGTYSSLSECNSKCPPSGYYNSGECGGISQGMFYMTQPIDYTQSTCEAYANSEGRLSYNIGFNRNCCWWNIANNCEDYCDKYNFVSWFEGYSTPNACSLEAIGKCNYYGLQVAGYKHQGQCCCWSCSGVG